ncbi:phage tail tube protein [Rubellimicrobium sp. CFH 75288]|uniref:phage tail tube protein n=1 Tax=Rubellimicrobium sp. CFH 75288 TaxID=2697034 RepID=UPI0014120AC7|nr:phage tail tube protein [Rubellimicrobium sp. CFH 75288]NAZ37148.1 hypothetical protein [Rubellimicrobium sp. CFH 75288]
MPAQGAHQATIVVREESTFGVPPGTSGGRTLRRVSTTLGLQKNIFASNEARVDQQVGDLRHGMMSVSGSIEREMTIAPNSEGLTMLLAGALRGSWEAGATLTPADFATGVTITNGTGIATGRSVLTFAGAGNVISKGFKNGDIIRATGLTAPENNNRNLRVMSVGNNHLHVLPQITVSPQQATGWSIAVVGSKLVMGTMKRSFTIEQSFEDAGVYELFHGIRVNGMRINISPNSMDTITFDLLGQRGVIGNAPYFVNPTAQSVGGTVTGADGALRVGGVDVGVVTALQINLQNNLSQPPVIGSNVAPEIFYGKMVVTGSVTAMLDGPAQMQAFEQESEIDLVCVCQAAGAEPKGFLSFAMSRVKYTGLNKTVGPDGAVLLQIPFQALLPTGTVQQGGSLTIQRSFA